MILSVSHTTISMMSTKSKNTDFTLWKWIWRKARHPAIALNRCWKSLKTKR